MQHLQVKKLNNYEYLLTSGDNFIGRFDRDYEEDEFFMSLFHGTRISSRDIHMIMSSLVDINKEYLSKNNDTNIDEESAW